MLSHLFVYDGTIIEKCYFHLMIFLFRLINNIMDKLNNNIELTDEDAYLFSVLPFTPHEMDTVALIEHLCCPVNDIEISKEHRYIIKLCQILWVLP